MTRILRRRVVIAVLLSPHCVICPMDFHVHQRKHQQCGTRRSYTCRHRRFEPDFDCRADVGSTIWRATGSTLGTAATSWAVAGPQCSTLVLGPPRSGKTSSLVIPNILLADGPVLSTSTKPDVMQATAPARAAEGWTFLYDPSGEVACPPGVERVGWSPITTASDWDAAVVTADAMVGASRSGGQRGGEHHWTERSGALLSTLLHAAATEKLPMRDVLKWIDRHNGAPALEILASNAGEDAPATDLLAGIVATDSREQSGIWSTASGVLAAYRTEGALASTQAPPLDLEEFCGGANTLYICSTGRRQRQFAPLVVAIIGDVRDAAYARSRDGQAGAAHAPRTRRSRQHRPHPRPAGHGQRGRRPGTPRPGLPAGPLTGSRPVGLGGRRVPVAVRHHGRPARHCRHVDAARHQCVGRRPGGRHHDAQPFRGPLGPPPPLDVGRHRPPAAPSGRCRGARHAPATPSSSGRTRRCTR